MSCPSPAGFVPLLPPLGSITVTYNATFQVDSSGLLCVPIARIVVENIATVVIQVDPTLDFTFVFYGFDVFGPENLRITGRLSTGDISFSEVVSGSIVRTRIISVLRITGLFIVSVSSSP